MQNNEISLLVTFKESFSVLSCSDKNLKKKQQKNCFRILRLNLTIFTNYLPLLFELLRASQFAHLKLYQNVVLNESKESTKRKEKKREKNLNKSDKLKLSNFLFFFFLNSTRNCQMIRLKAEWIKNSWHSHENSAQLNAIWIHIICDLFSLHASQLWRITFRLCGNGSAIGSAI